MPIEIKAPVMSPTMEEGAPAKRLVTLAVGPKALVENPLGSAACARSAHRANP